MRHKLGKIYWSFISRFRKTEDDFHEAMKIFSEGKFEEAKRRFQTLYNLMCDQQFTSGKRIHLGASLHMIGLSLFFTWHFEEALDYFLQAYLADLLNTEFEDEDKADREPAYFMLKNVYMLNIETLELLKTFVSEKINREKPVDVTKAFKVFMQGRDKNQSITEGDNSKFLNTEEFKNVGMLLDKFFLDDKARALLRRVPPELYEQIALKSLVIALEDDRELARKKDIKRTLKDMHLT